MKGLEILENGFLEQVNNGSTTLSLLGRGEGIELMKQAFLKDTLIILFPGENDTVQEFYYVLEGQMEVEIDNEKRVLKAHDCFSAKKLEQEVYFTAKTDVSFLSISTAPTFHYMSDVIKELRKIGKAVEKKDRYTHKHSSRVAHYAVKTASKMKLRKEQTEGLLLASILHDIGKINIPEEILRKPGKLTNEEFDLMKTHPGEGAAMIRETPYADIADIIEQHHERVNGRGYPFGLKGDEILIEAKIIGVCDTFDAMTEDRAYRAALSAEYAMAEINSLIGIQYDEEVVKAFEQVLKEEGKLTL
ncbi:metal dependent phosphohydrolase [Planococcus donghaensis MPA1U2]|uniref:Metal dependent phosphohydrolase n=1 Tax=Planococcus donghaensis MPA1U2 TaxID=933115 RepID=E7RJG6_9BACL|nr:HD-GYP domain-containing protein [Planococcus donghaensis]EGA88808.1 metal dependent phosphohydrolase [Planococcus donghaensis MPA1U2]